MSKAASCRGTTISIMKNELECCGSVAFTLVELILVVVVLFICAALLIHAFSDARERGREMSCASKERQIGIALNAYLIDSKDVLPVCEGLSSYYGYPTLKRTLLPYAGNSEELFKCPSDMASAKPQFQEYGTSYEWNIFVNGMKIDRAKLAILGLNIVCPILSDANPVHYGGKRNYLYPDGSVNNKSSSP